MCKQTCPPQYRSRCKPDQRLQHHATQPLSQHEAEHEVQRRPNASRQARDQNDADTVRARDAHMANLTRLRSQKMTATLLSQRLPWAMSVTRRGEICLRNVLGMARQKATTRMKDIYGETTSAIMITKQTKVHTTAGTVPLVKKNTPRITPQHGECGKLSRKGLDHHRAIVQTRVDGHVAAASIYS